MKGKTLFSLMVFLFTIVSCGDNEDTVITTVTTDTGKTITMNGIWRSDCVDFSQYRLKETFDFSNDNLLIIINQYEDLSCEQASATETVSITFQVVGTLEVEFQGSTVKANKVTGTQKLSRKPEASQFNQTFYIKEIGNSYELYHGVFEDDGGSLSEDGFPLDLHPFAISKS